MSRHWRRLLFLFGRGHFDADLRDEMQRHLEMRAQKLMDDGVASEEAHHRARREFGNGQQLKESSRELWKWKPPQELAQDLRYTVRMLTAHTSLTAAVPLALGLRIVTSHASL